MKQVIHKYAIFLLLPFMVSKAFSQSKEIRNEFDSGNIVINDSIVKKCFDGFYNYVIINGKFNYPQYFIGITFSKYDDSSTRMEINLLPYSIERNEPNFYGYDVKNHIYFVFWNNYNNFLERNIDILNPPIFKTLAEKTEKCLPLSNFDPYRWEIVFSKSKIFTMSPEESTKFIKQN